MFYLEKIVHIPVQHPQHFGSRPKINQASCEKNTDVLHSAAEAQPKQNTLVFLWRKVKDTELERWNRFSFICCLSAQAENVRSLHRTPDISSKVGKQPTRHKHIHIPAQPVLQYELVWKPWFIAHMDGWTNVSGEANSRTLSSLLLLCSCYNNNNIAFLDDSAGQPVDQSISPTGLISIPILSSTILLLTEYLMPQVSYSSQKT